jgi:copper chaperone CopZ
LSVELPDEPLDGNTLVIASNPTSGAEAPREGSVKEEVLPQGFAGSTPSYPAMTCDSCAMTVTEEVSQVAGVQDVAVELATGRLKCDPHAGGIPARIPGWRFDTELWVAMCPRWAAAQCSRWGGATPHDGRNSNWGERETARLCLPFHLIVQMSPRGG